ncbi:MAG: hypothetical protein ACPGJV_15795 [Bacteriovoracaceae bacterium]
MQRISIISLFALFIFIGCESRNETITNVSPNSDNQNDGTVVTTSANDSGENCIETTEYLSANLISNGSFEEGHSLSDNSWSVFSSLGAWQIDTTYNDAGIEIQRGHNIGGLAPSHGDSKLEFDAHDKNGFSASDVAVYQEVDTDAASDYLITFDYSPRISGNKVTNAAEVYWDGELIGTLNAEVKGWQRYTFIVSGAGLGARLAFKGYVDNNTVGGYLDDVSMVEILDDETGADSSIVVRSCDVSVD